MEHPLSNKLFMQRVVSSKYDAAIDYHISMYDTLPYQRNRDEINAQALAMYSTHLVKYYLCVNQEECFEINNHDDIIEQYLAQLEKEQYSVSTDDDMDTVISDNSNGITEEQIQTLLDDSDSPEEQVNNIPINAFEGVDDW